MKNIVDKSKNDPVVKKAKVMKFEDGVFSDKFTKRTHDGNPSMLQEEFDKYMARKKADT